MRSNQVLGRVIAMLAVLSGACSSSSESSTGTSGGAGSAGTSHGTTASGGASAGGKSGSGGQTASGGTSSSTSQALGGSTGVGGSASTAGSSSKGGTSASSAAGISTTGGSRGGAGGTGANGGFDAGAPDAGGTGGRAGGGTTGVGGTNSGTAGNGGTAGSSIGNPDAGNKDGTVPEGGTGGGTGTFDPCPASGPCKILPLGDSITWGVNYDGGYRVKLFTSATTDKKNITYVGKLSNGPSTIAGTTFPQKNEGHSGWTIQQIDDIVTGKSSEANYSGKKMMTDLAPHIVLLHAGTNDTSRSPTGMSDRLGTLIDHILTDGPDVLLVVTTIIPIKQGSYGTVGETFNNAVPGVVQKRIDAGKHVILVDMFKSFPSAGLSNDGVHPNQQGYDWMAGVWYEAIKGYFH
jgi:lysophospholipase L1-like esterase